MLLTTLNRKKLSVLATLFLAVLSVYVFFHLLLQERQTPKSLYDNRRVSCSNHKALSIQANELSLNSSCFYRAMLPNYSEEVALLGGGPSSVIPLIATSGFDEISYFGNPWDSFVLAGRDPQKTVLLLLKVARKYQTYKKFSDAAREYYRYIAAVAKTFSLELETAIGLCYDWLPQGSSGEVLLVHKGTGKFIIAKQDAKGYSLPGKKVGTELGFIESKSLVNDCVLLTETFIVSECSGTSLALDAGKHCFDYPPRAHGDFHYVGMLSDVWKDVSLFKAEKYGTILNRAGFTYSHTFAQTLLNGLNVDYIEAVAQILNTCKPRLGELQRRVLKLLQRYSIEKKTSAREIRNTDCFIVTGAGRAAGEAARRLSNDIIHATNPGELAKVVTEGIAIDDTVNDNLEKLLTASLEKRKKKVVVIDHKKVDTTQLSQVESLVRNPAYCNFLLELTKFSFQPTLGDDELEYYKKLLMSVKAVLKKEKFEKEQKEYQAKYNESYITTSFFLAISSLKYHIESTFGIFHAEDVGEDDEEGIVNSLQRLISQSSPDENFCLISSHSRSPDQWKKLTMDKISKHLNIETVEKFGQNGQVTLVANTERSTGSSRLTIRVVGVGGSLQAGPGEHKYSLSRMQDSHYRNENLDFINFIGSTESNKNNFMGAFLGYLISGTKNEYRCSDHSSIVESQLGTHLSNLGIVCQYSAPLSKF